MSTSKHKQLSFGEYFEIIQNIESDLESDDEILDDIKYLSDDIDANIENRNWKQKTNFTPQVFEFKGQQKVNFVSKCNNAIEYFLNYFDNNVVDILVKETNRYYEHNPIGEKQKMIEWENVSRNEIYTFCLVLAFAALVFENSFRKIRSEEPEHIRKRKENNAVRSRRCGKMGYWELAGERSKGRRQLQGIYWYL